MDIRSYFDLSQPVTVGGSRPEAAAEEARPAAAPSEPSKQWTMLWQLSIYVLLILSIWASRFMDLYRAGVADSFALDWPYLLFTAIVALLFFPVVYDKAQLSKDRPILVQIGLIFTAGIGWEKFVATVVGK